MGSLGSAVGYEEWKFWEEMYTWFCTGDAAIYGYIYKYFDSEKIRSG